jgi:hypothetical protein
MAAMDARPPLADQQTSCATTMETPRAPRAVWYIVGGTVAVGVIVLVWGLAFGFGPRRFGRSPSSRDWDRTNSVQPSCGREARCNTEAGRQ